MRLTASNGSFLLCLAGLGISSYLYSQSFSGYETMTCPINSSECAAVNSSDYGKIGVFPVSMIGMFGYLLLLFLFGIKSRSQSIWVRRVLTAALSGAFLISGALIAISLFILKTLCSLCLLSAFIVTALLTVQILEKMLPKKA